MVPDTDSRDHQTITITTTTETRERRELPEPSQITLASNYRQTDSPERKTPNAEIPRQTDRGVRETTGGDKTDIRTELHPHGTVIMQVCTVVEKRAGAVVGAELACSVREENKAQRESYKADWNSVNMKTRAMDR